MRRALIIVGAAALAAAALVLASVVLSDDPGYGRNVPGPSSRYIHEHGT